MSRNETEKRPGAVPQKNAVPKNLDEMIAKRKLRWQEGRGIEYDRVLVETAVDCMLSHPHLSAEALEKPWKLVELCFTVVDKRQRTVPFFFNEVQNDFIRHLEQDGTDRPYFILKGRQQGFTTLITAIQLACAITKRNFSGFTLTNSGDNTSAIFNDKCRAVYSRLPQRLKPSEKYNNAREMYFDKLNSTWRTATATDDVARSRTLNFVHYSEVAFYECDLDSLQKSIGEATVKGAVVVYETTANGFNQAHDLWESGVCWNLFYEWWRSAEYRDDDISSVELLTVGDKWLADRVEFLRTRGLDEEQIAWYCKKYKTYLDKAAIRQEYPCTPEEAFVFSGSGVFDAEALTSAMSWASTVPPIRVGTFSYRKVRRDIRDRRGEVVDEEWRLEDVVFDTRPDGWIVIQEEPQLRLDADARVTGLCPYVLGGDTAGSGEDYYTGKVVNAMTHKTAATLRVRRTDDDLYAEQMLCLAMMYHNALIGIETNFSPSPMRTVYSKYGYPFVYRRETFGHGADKPSQALGFLTTAQSKPVVIGELVSDFREDVHMESHRETLSEMMTFVRLENGGMGAVSGAHDDLVMALAIAHHLIGVQDSRWQKPEKAARTVWNDWDGKATGGGVYEDNDPEADDRENEKGGAGTDVFGWDDI